MHDKQYTLYFSPMRQNGKAYTMTEKTRVMIPVCFFQMAGICVTPSLLRIQNSAEIQLLKEQIKYYHLSTLTVKNKGSTQSKQKLPQILPLKTNKRISFNTNLEVTDDEGLIHLLINLEYTVIVAESDLTIRNTPHPTNLLLCETNVIDSHYKTYAATGHYF